MKRERNELMLRRTEMITATKDNVSVDDIFFSIYAVKLDKKGQRYRDNNRCLSLV